MYIMYSLASLPLIYAFSFTPTTELLGFINFFLINVIACFLDMVLSFIAVYSQSQPTGANTATTTNGVSKLTTTLNNIRWPISVLFPSINLKNALFNIRLRSNENCITALNSIMYTSYSYNEPWMSSREPSLGIPFIIFCIQMTIWWFILILIENRIYIKQTCGRCCGCSNRLQRTADSNNDENESNNGNNKSPTPIPHEWDDSVWVCMGELQLIVSFEEKID